MGFAEQSNSSLRSNRALDDRRHKRIDRVLETYRKITKSNKASRNSKKTITEQQIEDFRAEMKEERRQSDLLRVLALMISVVIFMAAVWFFFFR